MAKFTFQLGDNRMTRVQDAFAAVYNYPAFVEDGNGKLVPNPQTKEEFFQRQVAEFIANTVARHEAAIAAETRRRQVEAQTRQEITVALSKG